MINANKKNGFTIIETLVVLTIIGLLFGLGGVNYREYSRRQSVESAYRSLKQQISYTRQLVLSGAKPGGAGSPCGTGFGSPALQNTRISINTSTSGYITYQIYAVCNGNTQSIKGPFDIPFILGSTLSPTSTSIDFASVTGQVSALSTITLTGPSGSPVYTITVNTNGEIE